MNKEQMTHLIRDLASKSLGREDIQPDDDFFTLGASSLTIVDLQVQLEAALGRTAPTSALMLAPSIQGWLDVYAAAPEIELSEAQAAR